MIIKAVLTEKSLSLAKKNKYTFEVGRNLTKPEIAALVEKTFNTKVMDVATVNMKGGAKTTIRGQKKNIRAVKKAIVETKDKLEIFEEKKGK